MFNTAIHTIYKSFLTLLVNIAIGHHERSESFSLDDVVGLAQTGGESDHSEVCWLAGIAIFVKKDDVTFGKYVRSHLTLINFIISCCKKMMSGRKFPKDTVQKSVFARGRSGGFFL